MAFEVDVGHRWAPAPRPATPETRASTDMDTALIVARLALALIFALAGAAKLADLPGSRNALEDFGVGARLARPAALLLPLAELLTAVLLLLAPTAQLGGLLAVVLLLLFIGGTASALRAGRTPDCHCFGQVHSQPAGAETLIRNGVLAAVALFVAVGGSGPSYTAWVDDHTGQEVALTALAFAAAGLAYAGLALWRENRRYTGRGGGPAAMAPRLAVGQMAPAFALVEPGGRTVAAAELVGDQRSLLVFMSSTCGPCMSLLPELAT